MTGAQIVALPDWQWRRGLLLPDGRIVQAVQDGVAWAEVYTTDSTMLLPVPHAVPDIADPLLPGWLLHLLIEACPGERISLTHGGRGGAWSLMVGSARMEGADPVRLLVDAHRRLPCPS